jgi:microsomal dipeptidase-like Zn-dependent dipeptidase
MKAERGISDSQLEALKASGGFVGVMPAETMLDGTPASPKCGGPTFEKFLTQYREIVAKVGADSVAIGSDWNGGVEHLAQTCGTGTSLDEPQGFWNIGQTGDLWKAAEKSGAPVPKPLSRVAARFLDAWERAEKGSAPQVPGKNP